MEKKCISCEATFEHLGTRGKPRLYCDVCRRQRAIAAVKRSLSKKVVISNASGSVQQ